jgi:nucleoside-diphosphate-sugar epimerase
MMLTDRTFLVTGGTGFIGSALVRALVRAGARVRSFDNDSRGAARRLGEVASEVELFVGDIREAQAVSRAASGVDCVCHLAYVNGTEFLCSQPDLVLDVAIRGMVNVIDACREHKIGDLVLASSSEVHQTPPTIPTDETVPLSIPDVLNPRYSYGGGKIACELMAVN